MDYIHRLRLKLANIDARIVMQKAASLRLENGPLPPPCVVTHELQRQKLELLSLIHEEEDVDRAARLH